MHLLGISLTLESPEACQPLQHCGFLMCNRFWTTIEFPGKEGGEKKSFDYSDSACWWDPTIAWFGLSFNLLPITIK